MEKPFDSDINNKTPFRVPKEYFMELPLKIDSHVHKKSGILTDYETGLKWAIPGVAVAMLVFFLIWNNESSVRTSSDQMLSEVSDDAIQAYLENTDVAYEEIIAFSDFAEQRTENVLPDNIEIDESEYYEIEGKLIFQ